MLFSIWYCQVIPRCSDPWELLQRVLDVCKNHKRVVYNNTDLALFFSFCHSLLIRSHFPGHRSLLPTSFSCASSLQFLLAIQTSSFCLPLSVISLRPTHSPNQLIFRLPLTSFCVNPYPMLTSYPSLLFSAVS